jgi:autotransporter-associated beta strand protein
MAFIATWKLSPNTNVYETASNWDVGAVPTETTAAFFGASTVTSLTIDPIANVGEWIFKPGAPQYSFTIGTSGAAELAFFGEGIVTNGNAPSITVLLAGLIEFFNGSTAGGASITNNGNINFFGVSTGGTANFLNNGNITFEDDTSAGSSTIDTTDGKRTVFNENATGGNAQLITDGMVDFSLSAGPAGDHKLTVGSIEGAGTYELGANQLTVGGNGLSKIVSGLVDDGGFNGSLVKVGHGKLTLSGANNAYSGGTTIEQGAFEVAAGGAAGTGLISFANTSKAKVDLEIDNAALSGHVFASNAIDFFGKHDFLDLTGLHFHPGATAKYHKSTHVLAVHSGSVTDTLTLNFPHGTHFAAASDHHGGTEVFLVFA